MNDTNTLMLAAVAILGVGAWVVLQQQQQQGDPTSTDATQADTTSDPGTENTILEEVMSATRNALGLWRPPTQYAAAIANAEQANGIPPDLLARLLYQESHYRQDIITGAVRSPAGAVGIAQFMPATAAQWGVNPLDPYQSIDGAARYLAALYRQFGTWAQALAAYNWGPGNVARRGMGSAPAETRTYVAQILGDVNNLNSSNIA